MRSRSCPALRPSRPRPAGAGLRLGRIGLLHRTGPIPIGETSVIVAASAPHRDEAFEAARFCIDTLKSSVPIWKRETWADGSEWGLDAKDLVEVPEGERS